MGGLRGPPKEDTKMARRKQEERAVNTEVVDNKAPEAAPKTANEAVAVTPVPERRIRHSPASAMPHYLRGIRYPATRTQLIDRAKLNNAPIEAIQLLESLPEGPYEVPTDVQMAIKDYGRRN